MSTQVRVAFDLSLAGAGNYFTIGDTPLGGTATPGALPLAGDVLTDVTDYVRSVSIRRGRSKFTDRFDSGQASFVLDNRTRLFDPSAGTAVSPYGPSMLPRKAVDITTDGQLRFTGQVEDFNLEYSLGGDSTTTFTCSDGFALLARRVLTEGTATAQLSGARVNAVLDDPNVDWPSARRSIDAGQTTLGANVVSANTDVLGYLATVQASEPGAVFINKAGQVEFRDRAALQTPSGVVFADDGSGVPFRAISREVGTELLYTQVTIPYVGGTATATNTSALTDYGLSELNQQTFMASGTDAQDLADYWSGLYAAPTDRISGLEVMVTSLSATHKGQVLSLEIGDVVTVRFTPNGIGAAIEQDLGIESIEDEITPESHVVRFNLSKRTTNVFIIGYTNLGEGVLGF
jgi:hypothetical protein